MKWNDIVMHECMNDEFTSEASLGIEWAGKNVTDDPETLRCKFCCINAESPDPIMSDKIAFGNSTRLTTSGCQWPSGRSAFTATLVSRNTTMATCMPAVPLSISAFAYPHNIHTTCFLKCRATRWVMGS